MDQEYVLINRTECEYLLKNLQRAIHYCEHAQPSSCVDIWAEPTATYPGASGYAQGTMKDVVCSLETYMQLSQ